MRHDMTQVVIERPRGGRAYSYNDVRVRCGGLDLDQLDNLPKKQGYRRPHKENGEWKEFSDLLGPLEGFLRSRIGQKWDDVFAEICEHVDQRNEVQYHLLTHISNFVEIHTILGDDGHVYYQGRYSSGPSRVSAGDMFVHPETGLLCSIPKKKVRNPGYDAAVKRLYHIFGHYWHKVIKDKGWRDRIEATIKESKNHYLVGLEQELHKIDGIWYWAVFADVPLPFTETWFDTKAGETRQRTIQRGACDYLTGNTLTEGRYRSGRRQANRRELRRYGLRND